jgi:hypothetical protein
MKTLKNLLPYLLLNIIISAATTLAVLYFWDAANQSSLPTALPPVVRAATKTATPVSSEQRIKVDNVIGVGDLQNEVVLLKRVGDGELNLAGWKLVAPGGQEYRFPALLLYKDGAVQVYSRAGPDSAVELFWGLSQAAWKSGAVVKLVDASGKVQGTYSIP